ncbi:hypothetical protein B0H34DRAFT_680002 [Crassisporium funariophilum]|nr:hypothetical protein B0H34DRAFT_680002 [Crassisporium funariophilum]
MASNNILGSPTKDHRSGNRVSQHLRTTDPRVGSRSPNSIPSSPTSVHSSSSAIFERDIEPIAPPSPPTTHHNHPPNPHRIARAKGTEQLEQSVPSVLDSAAAILAGLEDTDVGDQVAVVSPASSSFDARGQSSGFASPIGSLRSRSPSPLGLRVGMPTQTRAEILLSIPHSNQAAQPHAPTPAVAIASPTSVLGLHNMTPQSTLSPSSASSPRPLIVTSNTSATITQVSSEEGVDHSAITPSIVTPTSAYFSTTATVSGEASPTTTTREHPPSLPSPGLSPTSYPSTSLTSPHSQSLVSSPISSPKTNSTTLSHPPSPVHVAKKRLSFMSYSDLLSSTPASTQPLSSLTTCVSMEPPPHIPSVSGLNIASAAYAQQQAGSAATSIRGFSLVPTGGLTHVGKRDSIAMLDNIGGEWEREGLGRGLEERLEALVLPPVMGGKA